MTLWQGFIFIFILIAKAPYIYSIPVVEIYLKSLILLCCEL